MINAKLFLKRHSSTILACLGCAGVIVTSVTAVRATPKAIKLLEEAEENKGSELTTWEKAKTTTKAYLPSILFGVSTIACIAGSSILSYNTQKSMASAYALINQSYRDYRRKAKDIYGEDADRKILDAIIAEKAKTMYVEAPGICDCAILYIDENHGEKRLFYDEYGKRFFESTLEQVISAEYHTNRNFVLRGSQMLNEFYGLLGLEPTDFGWEAGWCVMDEYYWIDFDHSEIEIDGKKCIVIRMPWEPKIGYDDDNYYY